GGSASGNVFPNGSVSYNGSVSAAGQSRDVSGSGIAAQDSQALVDGSATGNNAGGGSTSGNNADSGSASDNVSPNGSVSYNGSGSAAQDSQALAGGSATGNNAGGGSASGNAAANGSVSYNGSGNAAQDSQARANGSASVNTANGSASDNGAAPSAAAQTGSKPPSGPAPQPAPFKIDRIEDNQSLLAVGGVLGIDDVILQPETDMSDFSVGKEAVTIADMSKLRDLNYLRTSFYTVAKETALTAEDFDADSFVQTGLKIDNSVPGPKILIFHTHSSEMYADSDPNDPTDGVVAVGEKLADVLRTKYGIECLHDTGQYDMVDGVHTVMGAYERMEPEIEKILAANPSIQAAVDLHRDGLTDESIKLVTTVNGVPTAQIMFFNGLCKLNKNGVLTPIEGLPNPYIQTNLAFSFMAQLEANALYPDFTRKIYLNAYRYSLNMLPKSMLIEVGAQTNTKQEALNAMYPLADVLAAVLK
ncbi:MAG: stage II sporulation protein P, partial [Firmicutes bacterium]|nr:stage II sporulation protein P [Bacillota bacterium]